METPGEVLKRERENQKISIAKVSDDTHIRFQHIQALEEDNYSIFPGETYTIGFLKQYATYLNISESKILQLYHSALLEQVEPPIEELTKPTTTSMDYFVKYFKIISIPLGVILIGLIGFLFYQNRPLPNTVNNKNNSNSNFQTLLSQSDSIPDRATEHISLDPKFPTGAVIAPTKGINFSLLNSEIYIILEQLNFRQETNGQSSAIIELYPGRKKFKLYENKKLLIQEENIPHEFSLTLSGATPNNIKLEVEADIEEAIKEANRDPNITETRITNPSNYILRFEAYTTGQNFVEFYVDGQPQKKGLLPKGSRILYEANESIQMKIGDAGAIEIKINGKDYNFGRRGQQVKKIILKEKDPLEQTKFRVVVKDS